MLSRRNVRTVIAGALVAALVVPGVSLGAEAPGFAVECLPVGSGEVVIGEVTCQRIDSGALGGVTAFSYYVPPACGPESRCPTLYLLSGLGFDYREMVGTRQHPSAWVRALTSGPPVDPTQVADPWNYADPARWIPLEPIDLILIAPHDRTVAGGFGPAAGMEGYWVDWNPRYASDGDAERYATPPPRFQTHIVDELLPWVETHLPALTGRGARAVSGTDTGGFGSYLLGLQRPDLWSAVGSVSGAPDIIPMPGISPIPGGDALYAIERPPLPYQPPPRRPAAVDAVLLGIHPYVSVSIALGDPASDQAYIQGNMPRHLTMNARASAGREPSLYLRATVGDAVPRRVEDAADPIGLAGAQAVEAILLANNLSMEAALRADGVQHEFEIHPGINAAVYRSPFFRAHLAALYARLQHSDGLGAPPPAPSSFDFRSIARSFTVWGWGFDVEREATEFLNLRDVSCRGLTLQGTGTVTVSVPQPCGTGLDGERAFTVDLGAGSPADAGASAFPGASTRTTVELSPLG